MGLFGTKYDHLLYQWSRRTLLLARRWEIFSCSITIDCINVNFAFYLGAGVEEGGGGGILKGQVYEVQFWGFSERRYGESFEIFCGLFF